MTNQKTAPSAFKAVSAAIAFQGYRPIPLMPGKKVPGECKMGRWFPMVEWQEYRTKALGPYQIKVWSGWDDAGIGVITGTEVTPDWEFAAVDFDTDDQMMLEMMESALPESPVKKRGRRGHTSFYLVPTGTKTRSFKRGSQMICEILVGNGARQTVLPPSIHPDTGQPYIWLTKETLATLAPIHLPRVTAEMIDRFVDTVEHFGGGEIKQSVCSKFIETGDGSPHNLLNTAALRNLSNWVPDLKLDRCKPTSSGYVAVPHWRASMNGVPDAERQPALGFSVGGIRDFSADLPHSPLDIVMLSNSWDLDTAFEWLAPRVGMYGGGEEFADFNPGSSHQAVAVLPPHDPETGEVIEAEPVAPVRLVDNPGGDITQVPGLVGDLVDWICKTSRQPNRMLALGAAITVVGTLMGRRVAGPTLSGTHLYIIALAPSGAGKDHALRQISTILKAANAGHLIGPDDFMSMSAVIAVLKRAPLCLCPMDEFGSYVARISHPKASPHEKGMTKTLRSAWAASFSSMQTPEWAGKPAEEIYAPALSIYGNSTPAEFFEALQGVDVVNGFLNRFLMIRTEVTMKDRDPDLNKFEIPSSLKAALASFYSGACQITERERADPHNKNLMPTVMDWENSEAKEAVEALRQEIEILRRNDALDPYYARTVEMSIRLATICAAGRKLSGAISAQDIKWGRAVAMMSAQQMIEAAGDHMAGSEHARYGNRIVRFMKKRNTAATKRDIHIALKGELKVKELKDVLDTMVEMGRIKEIAREKPIVGRPPSAPSYALA